MACQSNQSTQTNTEETETTATTTEVNHDCMYCGMPSQEFPKWNVKMVSEKGEAWFCSPRCMFFTITDPKTTPQDIQSLEVSDYYSTERIDAREAFYVTHSDVTGPMGHDFVPLQDEASAKEFQKDHKGKTPILFQDVNIAVLQNVINQ